MGIEKRVRDRITYKKELLCYSHIAVEKEKRNDLKLPIILMVFDISYTGIGVYSSIELKRGDVLIFNLENKGEKIEVKTKVMWSHYRPGEHKSGLAILNLTRDNIVFLNNIIKQK